MFTIVDNLTLDENAQSVDDVDNFKTNILKSHVYIWGAQDCNIGNIVDNFDSVYCGDH